MIRSGDLCRSHRVSVGMQASHSPTMIPANCHAVRSLMENPPTAKIAPHKIMKAIGNYTTNILHNQYFMRQTTLVQTERNGACTNC